MPRFPRVALLSPPDASTGTTPDAASSSSDAVRRALAPRGVELVSPEAADVLLALPGAVLSPADNVLPLTLLPHQGLLLES